MPENLPPEEIKNQEENNIETFDAENEISYYTTVPSEIIYDTTISIGALKTYLIISGFFKKSGYCFASDQWIADVLQTKKRVVQDYLNELEQKSYIIRESFNEGFKKRRKIWKPSAYKKTKSKNVCEIAPQCYIDVAPQCYSEIAAPCYSNNNNISTNYTPPTPSSFANAHSEGEFPQGGEACVQPKPNTKIKTIVQEEYIERKEHVKTTKKQHETMLEAIRGDEFFKRYNANPEQILDKCYQILSEWKINKPDKKKWGKFDHLAINGGNGWVLRAVKETMAKDKKFETFAPSVDLVENHRQRAKKLMALNPKSYQIGETYIAPISNDPLDRGGQFGSKECEMFLKRKESKL